MSQDRPHIPAELRRRILVEAGHRCAIHTCRFIEVEIHHIDPWEEHQQHEYENLIALCPNCHARADRGDIDRKSLRYYKANLRLLHDRFSTFEVDFLFKTFNENGARWPSCLTLMLNRLIDAGYIAAVEEGPTVVGYQGIGGFNMRAVTFKITESGREAINLLGLRDLDSR